MLIQHIKVMNELMNGMKDEEELLISVFMYIQRKNVKSWLNLLYSLFQIRYSLCKMLLAFVYVHVL